MYSSYEPIAVTLPDKRDKYLGGVTMYIILKEVLCFLVFYDGVSGVRY